MGNSEISSRKVTTVGSLSSGPVKRSKAGLFRFVVESISTWAV